MVVEGHCGTHCINRGMGVRGHDLGTLLQRNARPLWATGELSQKQPGGGEERGHGKGRGNKTTTTSCSQGAQLAGWSQVLASAPFQATRRLEGLCVPKGVEFRMDQKLQGQFSVLRLRALMVPETFQMAATFPRELLRGDLSLSPTQKISRTLTEGGKRSFYFTCRSEACGEGCSRS